MRLVWNISSVNCIRICFIAELVALLCGIVIFFVEFFSQNVVRNWYARFSQITNNAKNLVNNAEEAAKALKEGTLPWCHCCENAKQCTSKMLTCQRNLVLIARSVGASLGAKINQAGYTEVIAYYRTHLSFHAGNIEKFGACWTCYRHQKSLMAPGEYGGSQWEIFFTSLLALT